jgi:hypothetical protein
MSEEWNSAEVLLQEQLSIVARIKSLGSQVNDLFSMINLKESSEWTSEQLQNLDQMQLNMSNNFNSLEEDLKQHYNAENNFFRSYLGPYLLEAITRESHTIIEQLENLGKLFTSTDIRGLNREDSLVKILAVRQAIENFNQSIESHSQKVDCVLKLLKTVVGTEPI